MVKKVFFPFGISILLLIAFATISIGGVSIYSYLVIKAAVIKAESDVKAYVSPLLDACVQIANNGDDKKNKFILDPMFADYRRKGIATKAFFVKDDGSIVAHSDPSEAATLNNNIATDEFTYNIDQIFLPIKQHSAEIYLSDYYLIDRKFPFNKRITKYLKKYFDNDIDRNGWLICKGVYDRKGKGYGVVAFIVNKEDVYETILKTLEDSIILIKIALAGSTALAFIFSIFIFIRYRMIEFKSLRSAESEMRIIENRNTGTDYSVDNATEPNSGSGPVIHTEFSQKRKGNTPNFVILDAIPVKRKGAQ